MPDHPPTWLLVTCLLFTAHASSPSQLTVYTTYPSDLTVAASYLSGRQVASNPHYVTSYPQTQQLHVRQGQNIVYTTYIRTFQPETVRAGGQASNVKVIYGRQQLTPAASAARQRQYHELSSSEDQFWPSTSVHSVQSVQTVQYPQNRRVAAAAQPAPLPAESAQQPAVSSARPKNRSVQYFNFYSSFTNLRKNVHPSSLNQLIYAHVQCRDQKKASKRFQF